MKKYLMQEKVVKPEVPVLTESHTTHKKRVWEYHRGELMKTKKVLEGILSDLLAVLMSICDSDSKNEVKANTDSEL